MPEILIAEISLGSLLEWSGHLRTVLKCHHVDIDGRGGADGYMEQQA
jgi:hypothetical protein